jgi:hypothetical protein
MQATIEQTTASSRCRASQPRATLAALGAALLATIGVMEH